MTTPLTRRDCLIAGGALLTASAALPAIAALPIGDAAYNTRVLGRLQGDLSGRQRWLYNPGFVYATQPGLGLAAAEFGRLLYRVEGFTSRISRLLPDGSVEEKSHSWMFYKDAVSDEYLDTYVNPITGETLKAPPFRGGPAQSRLVPARGVVVEGMAGLDSTLIDSPVQLQWRTLGEHVHVTRHGASRIRTADGTIRNEFSIDAWVCRAADLADESRTHLPSTYSWTSQAEWQGWLNMKGRPGWHLWRIETAVLDDVSQLPPPFVARMNALLPGKLLEPLRF